MTSDLLIYGAGPTSRLLAARLARYRGLQAVAFVVDDDCGEWELDGIPVLADRKAESRHSGLPAVIGDPAGGAEPEFLIQWRVAVYGRLVDKGVEVRGYRDPDAEVWAGASLHPTTIVLQRAVVEHDTLVGANTVVGPAAVVTRGSQVGRDCWLGPQSIVAGKVDVADRCFLGEHASLRSGLEVLSDVTVLPGAVVQMDARRGDIYRNATARVSGVSLP